MRVETSFRIGYPGLAILLFPRRRRRGVFLLINILFYDRERRLGGRLFCSRRPCGRRIAFFFSSASLAASHSEALQKMEWPPK